MTPRGNLNLLDFALNSLKTSPVQEKRAHIFAANQRAIENIRRVNALGNAGKKVNNLQIQPNINGEADKQPAMPLAKGETFQIELTKLPVPDQCGGGNVRDLIKRLCGQFQIKTEGRNTRQAQFTPVVTALAGQYPDHDTTFKGVTKAEFVPVYHSNYSQKHVLAISYSLNGETGLKTDLMLVDGSMTCLGRKSQSTSAMQAIELPNQLAASLHDQQPELFDQLQKSSCIVVFVEFDVIQPHHDWEESGNIRVAGLESLRGESQDGPVMRGTSKGISAFSVVGQGSYAYDHSHTVCETGTRKLSNIHVYGVGAMVVNTHEQELTDLQAANIETMMRMRAKELGRIYSAHKTYTYNDLDNAIAAHIEKKYGISTTNTNIFENAMLKLTPIDENPYRCRFKPSLETPESFYMDLGISADAMLNFIAHLQQLFGHDFCCWTPSHNLPVCFSLSAVMSNIDAVKKSIDDILASPRNLIAYQQYNRKQPTPFAQPSCLLGKFQGFIKNIDPEFKSDIFEVVLLNMFGCEEELHKARFKNGESYVGKMLDTHIYLDISEQATREMVARINSEFPNASIDGGAPARFIQSNARIADKSTVDLWGKGTVNLCELVIDSGFVMSDQFVSRFKDTLDRLIEEKPLLIEKLRMQGGKQRKLSPECASKLTEIATRITESQTSTSFITDDFDVINAGKGLTRALISFSSILTAPQAKTSDRVKANDDVRRAIAFFESKQGSQQNALFKQSEKKEIKDAQRELGLR